MKTITDAMIQAEIDNIKRWVREGGNYYEAKRADSYRPAITVPRVRDHLDSCDGEDDIETIRMAIDLAAASKWERFYIDITEANEDDCLACSGEMTWTAIRD